MAQRKYFVKEKAFIGGVIRLPGETVTIDSEKPVDASHLELIKDGAKKPEGK